MDDEGADAASRRAGSCRLVVISPHLDDGVFACGQALAAHPGSVVVTVFAGAPADGSVSTGWDARCGFASATEAVRARRAEDGRALARLCAAPRWLDFADSQYGATPTCDELAHALAEVVGALGAARVLAPLGLFHSDHRLAHAACRRAFAAHDDVRFYEDALYRALPGLLQARLGELAAQGLEATPAPSLVAGGHAAAKREAAACYASQLRAFGAHGYDDVREPERCWRLAPRGSAGQAP